jgi:hypothetical protein
MGCMRGKNMKSDKYGGQVETQTLWAPTCYGILSFPLGVDKWKGIRSKNTSEVKIIECTYSNVLRIRVTHTMIPELITSWSKTH